MSSYRKYSVRHCLIPLYQNFPPAISTISEVACREVFNKVLAERGNLFPSVFLLIISIIRFMDSCDWLVLQAQYLMHSLKSIWSNASLYWSFSLAKKSSISLSSSTGLSSSDGDVCLGRSVSIFLLVGTFSVVVGCWFPIKQQFNRYLLKVFENKKKPSMDYYLTERQPQRQLCFLLPI